MNTHLVPFHGETITAIETPQGIYVPVLPLCERLDVSRQGQQAKINAQPERWSGKMFLLETAAGPRETLCIPVNRIAAWLFTLSANKVKPEAREALIAYQREAADVLDRHFRLRHVEQETELARVRHQHAACAAFALAFNPLWAKIANLQKAGIERLTVDKYLSHPAWKIRQIVEEMETYGVIAREDWKNSLSQWADMHPDGRKEKAPETSQLDLLQEG